MIHVLWVGPRLLRPVLTQRRRRKEGVRFLPEKPEFDSRIGYHEAERAIQRQAGYLVVV